MDLHMAASTSASRWRTPCGSASLRGGARLLGVAARSGEKGRGGQVAQKWWAWLRPWNGGNEIVEMFTFLVAAASQKNLLPLLAQVLYGISVAIEKTCGALVQMKLQPAPSFSFRWCGVGDLIQQDGVETYITQFVANCTESFEKSCRDFVFSITTDKGTVNGLPLQDSVVAPPCGLAWICAPVVSFVGASVRVGLGLFFCKGDGGLPGNGLGSGAVPKRPFA